MKFNSPDNFALKTGGMPPGDGAPKTGQPPAEAPGENMFSDMFAELPDARDNGSHDDEQAASLLTSPDEVFEYDPRPSARARRQGTAAGKSDRRAAGTPVLRRAGPAARPPIEAPALDPQSVSQQIIEQLEKHNIATNSQLRIEVHDRVVVVAGEVPTAYERQLVGHFCRQIPGVVKFIDGMVLRSAPVAAAAKRAKPRSSGPSIEWRLPFQTKHIAMAVTLVVALWAGYSFATRDSSKMTVYAVTGIVLLDGEPAEGATVVLHPDDRSLSIRPRGVVDADGSFQLTTYLPGDGAPVGEYKVTIEWRKPVEVNGDFLPGPNLLPEALAGVGTTKLHASVPRGGGELEAWEISK